MTDVKITQLPVATAAPDAALFEVVNGGQSQQVTAALVRRLPAFAVATLPNAATYGAGAQIYVSDDVGGAVPAFSDGTNWRRVTDRAVITDA